MSGERSRALYLLGLLLGIAAVAVIVTSGWQWNRTDTANGVQYTADDIDRPWQLVIGIALGVVASLLALAAWVGALIRAAQAQEWVWFILLLVAGGITLLVYVIVLPRWSRAGYRRGPAYGGGPGYGGGPNYGGAPGYGAAAGYGAAGYGAGSGYADPGGSGYGGGYSGDSGSSSGSGGGSGGGWGGYSGGGYSGGDSGSSGGSGGSGGGGGGGGG